MEITDVRVRKTYPEGKMRAIVSVTFDDQFVVHDIKVIEGQNGFFIAMPSRKTPDGEFKDIAHPINMGTRRKMQESVLQAYEEAVEQERLSAAERAERDFTVDLEVDFETNSEMEVEMEVETEADGEIKLARNVEAE